MGNLFLIPVWSKFKLRETVQIMRILFALTFLLIAGTASAQSIKFHIEGQKDTTVHLVRYFGKGLYYADTAEIKGGHVEFDGSKQKPGILALFLPGQKLLEFIHNNEQEVVIESKLSNLMGEASVKKSKENMLFLDYARFIAKEKSQAGTLTTERGKFEDGSKRYEELTKRIDDINEKVEQYQLDLIKKNEGMFVALIVKMSMDIEIPEAPKDKAGNIDSTFRFKYYRSHYFDNINFADDRLVRTPIFHNKLEKYFSKAMMIQHWDTVIYYAFDLCDRLDPKSDMYQYCVSWITSEYEKSKIMGMDKVFVAMGNRYYCGTDEAQNPKAHWMPDDKLETLCERATKWRRLVMGEQPPNIILRDTTDINWRDFYSLESDYTLLYFWDPECGHCKKITPKLQTLYSKKLRDRNVEIFAVGKAVGEDFQKWKDFVKKHNLEFINVAVTDKLYTAAMDKTDGQQKLKEILRYTTLASLNYQKTYDIYSTPKVFILDKDKEIIAKSLSISQIEDLLDRLQDKQDAEKLFPAEEEPEDEKIH